MRRVREFGNNGLFVKPFVIPNPPAGGIRDLRSYFQLREYRREILPLGGKA